MVNTTERAFKLTGGAAEFLSALEHINMSMEDFVKLMAKVRDEEDKNKETAEGMLRGIDHAAAKSKMLQQLEADSVKGKIKELFKDLTLSYQQFVDDMRKQGGVVGAIGELFPREIVGIQSGVQKIKGSILSELPAGGLIGLMMLGAMREEEVRAAGASTMRMFQQSSQVGRDALGAINSEARRLGVTLGKGPTGMFGEFQASAQQFAQAGVDVEDVLKNNFKSPIEGISESALKSAVRLDTLFKSGSGTAAKEMAAMMRNFNLDASEAAKMYAGIGLAARDSGNSVTSFMTSVMQSSAAMRTMRVDIGEVSEAQLKFASIVQQQMPGVTKQFSAQYAETATRQITQGLAGMGIGLSAVLAERISNKEGKPVEGLDAYYAFKEGFGGAGQKEGSGVFIKGINELLAMTRETGGSKAEQRFFLEKMGMGFEGSKVLMEINKEIEQGSTIQESVAKHQKDLAGAFKDATSETSAFQRALLEIQDGIAKTGAGLLGTVVGGIKLIAGLLMGLTGETELGTKYAQEGILQSDASLKYMIEGIKQMPEGFKKGLEPILGMGMVKDDKVEARQLIFGGTIKDAMSGIEQSKETIKMYKDAYTDAKNTATKVGRMFSKDEFTPTKKDESSAKQIFVQSVSEGLREELSGKIDESVLEKLVNAYATAEKRTGKGEDVFAEEAKKAGLKQYASTAKNMEKIKSENISITSESGEKIALEVIVRTTGGYSGQVEGR